MLSVVVIGKNEQARIAGCIKSIRSALASTEHEILYVDSHSADESLPLARAAGARCLLPEDTRPTAALGRAIGALAAQGDTLLFLDGDMLLKPGFVKAALAHMQRTGCNGVAGIRDDIFYADGREAGRQDNVYGVKAPRRAKRFGGAVLLTRSSLLRAGNWPKDVVACEEAALYAALLAIGARVDEIPVPMITHLDAVQRRRTPFRLLFNRRRLGLGQALFYCLFHKCFGSFWRLEWQALSGWLLDAAGLLCLILWGLPGGILLAAFQALQLAFFILDKRPRAFITQKLYLPYLPLGFCWPTRRSLSYRPAEGVEA